MPEQNTNHKKMNYTKIAIWAALCTLVFWALSFFLLFMNSTDRGTFGDMFGAVNALFSGLAFAGLIVTLIMQHEELGLQREELAQTNKELAAQREEFAAQTKTMKIQRFENTLFNMLSLHQDIVNGLYYVPKDDADRTRESKGRYVFDVFYNTILIGFKDEWLRDRVDGIKEIIQYENTPEAYLLVREISIFDNYFRHLYRMFKYIDVSPLIDDSERYDYAPEENRGEKTAEILSYLQERSAVIPLSGHENALFLSIQKRRITVKSVERLVKKYAGLVTQVKKITPHKLRSTYGTQLYKQTGDIYLVADVLGHSDVNTTKKHYAAMEDERRRMARNMVSLREDNAEDSNE